jgi:hypothetical protein
MNRTVLTVILLLTSSIYTVNRQEQSKQFDDATKLKIEKLRQLEVQLEFIESLPPSASKFSETQIITILKAVEAGKTFVANTKSAIAIVNRIDEMLDRDTHFG